MWVLKPQTTYQDDGAVGSGDRWQFSAHVPLTCAA